MKRILPLLLFFSLQADVTDVYGTNIYRGGGTSAGFGPLDYTDITEHCPITCSRLGLEWNGTTHEGTSGPVCNCQ